MFSRKRNRPSVEVDVRPPGVGGALDSVSTVVTKVNHPLVTKARLPQPDLRALVVAGQVKLFRRELESALDRAGL